MRQDEEAFFADYAVSHKKLSELGFKATTAKGRLTLGQGAVAVVVAAAVIIFYFYKEHQANMKLMFRIL